MLAKTFAKKAAISIACFSMAVNAWGPSVTNNGNLPGIAITAEAAATYTYYKACAKSISSIVDGLKSIGADSGYSGRKAIAARNGISNYTGTAAQNSKLLSLLKAGKLVKSASTTSSKAATTARKSLSAALYNNSSAYISCGFDGYKTTKGRHEGIDIRLGNGKPIYALADGVVVRVAYGKNGSSGLSTIAIYNGQYKKTIIYLHSNPATLKAGQKIARGQKIGTEGWRGISSSGGSHTHVEVRNGKQGYACKSINDYRLDNANPASFWNTLGYNVK